MPNMKTLSNTALCIHTYLSKYDTSDMTYVLPFTFYTSLDKEIQEN
jgi:hypothetical protein